MDLLIYLRKLQNLAVFLFNFFTKFHSNILYIKIIRKDIRVVCKQYSVMTQALFKISVRFYHCKRFQIEGNFGKRNALLERVGMFLN